jgi:hypothetical protein
MRTLLLCATVLSITACGGTSSTAVHLTRWNFAVVDGRNQAAAAGSGTLANRITSQLTRDPQGTFASRALDRVGDFVLPALAYAQGISLAGEPVEGAIVCGREAAPGEPQVQPLCAFTLADGKAANTVVPGTKAGTYNIVFTAQVQSEEPVKDSTTVIVQPGPAVGAGGGQPCSTGQPGCYLVSVSDVIDLHITMARAWDQYDNLIDISEKTPSFTIRGPCGSPGVPEPNCWPAPAGLTPDGTGWLVTIDPKWAGTNVLLYVFLDGNIVFGWPLSVR